MHATKLQYSLTSRPSPTAAPAPTATSSLPASSPSSSASFLDPLSLRTNVTDLLTCLNNRHYHLLPLFLSSTALSYDSKATTIPAYISHLQSLVSSAPDLTFRLAQILVDAPSRRIAAMLAVEGTPAAGATFRGHAVAKEGRKVRYFEQVVWRVDEQGRIVAIESTVDEEAVRRQCARKAKGGKA